MVLIKSQTEFVFYYKNKIKTENVEYLIFSSKINLSKIEVLVSSTDLAVTSHITCSWHTSLHSINNFFGQLAENSKLINLHNTNARFWNFINYSVYRWLPQKKIP